MKHFIYENEHCLSKELCNEIISIVESSPERQYPGFTLNHYKKNNPASVNSAFKNTIDMDLFTALPSCISTILVDEIYSNISNYYSTLDPNNKFNFNLLHKNKRIYTLLLHKYKKNDGMFIYHTDNHINLETNEYRILNYLFYLNDVSEGGETEFFGYYKIKPTAGKLVIFPSEWFFPHTGKIPISNDKYVIAGWVYINAANNE